MIKTKISLVRTIFISMTTIAVISILLLGIMILTNQYERFNKRSKSLRDEFIETQKSIIKSEVDKAVDYIKYMQSKESDGLKDNLKNKTDQAHDIASNIYNENKRSKDLKEIKKMVKDALRPIRFNNGREYYFAASLDGVAELNVDRPEMEGKNQLDVRNADGKYVLKDMIRTAQSLGGGLYEYRWTKPGKEGNDFQKISYVRIFEPFGWIIGIGEYPDDTQDVIQKQILDRIAEIKFGKDGYIFVISYDGIILVDNAQRDLIGKNVWELADPNGLKVIQKERNSVENPDGGFVDYVWNKPNEAKPASKISYIKGIKDWRWMVGSGAYVNEIEKTISEDRAALSQRIKAQMIKISLIVLLLVSATYLTAKYISYRIHKSLVIFSSFFQKAADKYVKIDLKEVHFSEFEDLALSANSMIDRHEQAERSTRENEEKYRTLFHMESDALALIEVNTGDILEANSAFLNLFGYDKEELLTMKESDFSAMADFIDEQSNMDKGYVPLAYKKKKGGAIFPAEIKTRNFEYQGKHVQLLAIRDISDRKRLESQLQQSQKMEAIGTLAGGLAHDFNNILLPIMGNAEMLMMTLPPDNHMRYSLDQIYHAGKRASDMVKQILAFSRKDRQEKKPIKMGEIVIDAAKFLRSSIPTTIDIRYDIKTDRDMVLANSTQIHQVILNLCTNAAHSMREYGGLLRIELDDFLLESNIYGHFQNLTPGRYLRLTVSDTGEGIQLGIINRIFEPYYTTKGPGEGTGMGLAVVHGIIADHKGDIAVESKPGSGATFTILLPPYNGKGGVKVSDIDESKDIPRGNERILLVDDEKIVIDVFQNMLEYLGYNITTKMSSEEALNEFRNNPSGFDLIITDMTMPGMTGKELAMQMLSIRSDIPVILCTGFSERVDKEKAKAIGIMGFVMKPIAMNIIAKTIRDVLEKRGSSPK
jgi:two-component system, cell cycle sensor histidine kinase and response regulator CckA